MTAEAEILRQVLIEGSRIGRLWRYQVGTFWSGQVFQQKQGHVILRNAQAVKMGIPGMADTNGLVTITITPDMVGQKVAVFCAVECKTEKGRVSDDQLNYLGLIKEMGGRAGVARSPEDVQRIMLGQSPSRSSE